MISEEFVGGTVLDSVTLREVDSEFSSVLLESECENDLVFELEFVTVLL